MRLLILLPLIALVLVLAPLYIESRTVADRGRQAGASQDVQVAAGSGNVTLKITVTGFRVGSLEDLFRFRCFPDFQNKNPYYIWFKAKVTSGSLSPQESFPIEGGQWGAVSLEGPTLNGVRLSGDLQPCPP